MAILIKSSTRVICQGITGSAGAFHTHGCLQYGTQMVGGVTPGRGGTKDSNNLPIFNTVSEAVSETGADATMIFVPPAFAADAIIEAADGGISVICAITEGIPVHDMVKVKHRLSAYPQSVLIGPNCPGIISPGRRVSGEGPATKFQDGCKIGIMPGYIHCAREDSQTGKAVGIVSRSGTLTYEAVWQTSSLGLGQSTCVGIGGDPIRGLGFIECLELFTNDPETDAIVMIGEIGGRDEIDAAHWIKANKSKPIAAFIAGKTAPSGKRMGHAGAIVGGEEDTAEAKIIALRESGVVVAESPASMGASIAKSLGVLNAGN